MGRTGHPWLRRVGQQIRAVRTSRRLSQEALADIAGLDRSYMSGIERGVRNVTLLKMRALAKALKVSVHDLLPDD